MISRRLSIRYGRVMNFSYLILSICVVLTFSSGFADEPDKEPKPVRFSKEIKPIFEQRCVHCHNQETLPDRISFENADLAFSKDKFGKIYIVRGKPDESLIVKAVESPNFHEMMMPMVGLRTTKEESALIRRWIAEGAKWPKGPAGKVKVTFRAKE